MSQFQQPQDNRYVRPGVLDLGTGRRFDRLSVSTRGEGSIGSGAQGGGFVQGTSRTGTGLSGIDPLANILGAAAEGINSFLSAEKTMSQAVDRQRNLELDKLEEDYQVDVDSGMSPEDAAQAHRDRIDKFYAEQGGLSPRGTARKRFNRMRTQAEQAVRDFDFENEFNEHLDKMASIAGLPSDEKAEIRAFRERYEGGSHEESAIKLTQAALNSAQTRSQHLEDRNNTRILAGRFSQKLLNDGFISIEDGKEVINVEKVISTASSGPDAFDLSDPDAVDKLGAMIVSSMDISDMDERTQVLWQQKFSDYFATVGKDFIPQARQYVQETERRDQRIQHQDEWRRSLLSGVAEPAPTNNPFVNMTNFLQSAAKGLASISPEAQEANRRDIMASFMVTGTARYNALPLDERQRDDPSTRATKIMGYLLNDSIAIAQELPNVEDGLQVMADARKAIPQTLEEAVATGLIPLTGDGLLPAGIDETTWNSLRVEIDQTIRAAQAKAIEPQFKTAVAQVQASSDFAQLGRLNNQLVVLSGEADFGLAGPYGTLEDGDSIEILPLSQAGQEFGELALSLHRAHNSMMGNVASGSRTFNMLRKGFNAEQMDSGKTSRVSADEIAQSSVMQATGNAMKDYLGANPGDVSGALEAVASTVANIDYDPDYPIAAFDETRAVISVLQQAGDVPAPVAQAMVDAAMVVGYARSRGVESAKASVVVGADLAARINAAMNNSTSSAVVGQDGIFIGTLYEALGSNPQFRASVFGKHLDRAELSSNLIQRTGVTFDPEKYNWSGAIDVPTLQREQAVQGFDNLDALARSDDGRGYISVADDVLAAALDPVAAASSLPAGIASELQKGLLAMHEDVDDHMKTVREQYGIPENMTMMTFLSSVAPEIVDDLQITLASAFGDQNQYERMVDDPERMASVLSIALEGAVQTALADKTIMGLQPYSDPTGSLAHLIREVGQENANPAEIADRVFDTSVHDSALGAGHEYANGNEQRIYEKVFTSSFPDLLGDTPFQQVWEIASAGKDPEDVSFFDLAKAKLVDVDGAPIRMTQQELSKTQIETLPDGSVRMIFPTIGQTLNYRPYGRIAGVEGFAPLGRDTDPSRKIGQVHTISPDDDFIAAVMQSPTFDAVAQNRLRQQAAAARTIEKYDTDGDGKLTGAERDAMVRDRNKARRGG